MAIRRTVITASPSAGGSGASTATATSDGPVDGEVIAVHLNYLDSPPGASTDVTLVETGVSPAQTILAVTNAATSAWFYPMAQAKNQAAADITGMGRPIYVSANIVLTIAQADDGDGVTATIVWDDLKD